MLQPLWQIPSPPEVPQWFVDEVKTYVANSQGNYATQLLWQRAPQDKVKLAGFLDPDAYKPASPFEFGQEMHRATGRLQQAYELGEKVTIWGDFDADGITSTSVLWEGLGQFFPQHQQLNYYIPNRLKESHGLNAPGIDQLAAAGTQLIVTCDTGSTNLTEIDYAQQLGIDVIVTDHHTLPEERPSVIAIINPRYFTPEHPLYHLSGVAVAYKLIEALYETRPEIPQQPLENLLDLVAIGLIADLVQLSGDCRYLAQRGIAKLREQAVKPTRPGIAKLLELCRRTGDRPTDISFGIGPRINAVSRIHGDATFCVELLTSRSRKRCQQLAIETELANTRRKELQKNVTAQVKQKLAQIDLSTTSVIVLEDSQWQGGVLGLVAGQIAQEYGRPTILLNVEEESTTPNQETLARGSARSVAGIDLYHLVHSQAHLLHRFGGHPFAAGLSLPVANISLFREAINQQLRQQRGDLAGQNPILEADLIVTVAELGKELFQELKLLEPYGMGNPIPKLLLRNCWFTKAWNRNIKDWRGRQVQYIKSTFTICDDSSNEGFPGVWWGHYKDEIPLHQLCDAIVELDYNNHTTDYEVRLVALQTQQQNMIGAIPDDLIVDWRDQDQMWERSSDAPVLLTQCPISWDTIHQGFRHAITQKKRFALAYPSPHPESAEQVLATLVGIAKYLSRTGESATLTQIQNKLNLSNHTLQWGWQVLAKLGFEVNHNRSNEIVQISFSTATSKEPEEEIADFLAAVKEEQFLQEYFSQVPLTTLAGMVVNT